MSEDRLLTLRKQAARRQELLNNGLGLADLDEYNVLTLNLAEGVPLLLRALNDVIAFRDELTATPEGPVAPVARAFAHEIDRALKGQRS